MNFKTFGDDSLPSLMLIPGLGVSHEIFVPLIEILKDRFNIITVEIDGFTLGKNTEFTTVHDQARQAIEYIKRKNGGKIECIYGLSLGGKILSCMLERNEVVIGHAIMDAAPLLPLPAYLVNILRYIQYLNVRSCYRQTGFWKRLFPSHYFGVLLDECRKIYPFGGKQAILDGYKSVYTTGLHSVSGADIHYWHGTKESFAAKPQVKHLKRINPDTHFEIFKGMNHGQLLIDHPDAVAERIVKITSGISI
ncbi:MAG: alpha/beta hydrolase [Bacteroidaceae bacterium]|nr:alpha/beta hydrolase [Bacteroidaceae bacterium]